MYIYGNVNDLVHDDMREIDRDIVRENTKSKCMKVDYS